EELPIFDLRLVFRVGRYLDPEGEEGLASVTFDMLNEGAGDLSAEDISRKLLRLGSTLDTSANVDLATIRATGLVRNLEPTLDLLATVLTAPTFPEEDWTILQRRRIADVIAAREDPATVAHKASYRVLYGDTYRGRHATEDSYGAMTPEDMRAFYQEWVGPENAMVFVGGAVGADRIAELLEARIGGWKPEDIEVATPGAELSSPDESTLYFIDKPGAAQSVLRVATPVGTRHDEDYFPLLMANEVLGGHFTSRVNLNLREDKGYTYGARCFIGNWDGPGVWGCSTSVQTEVTGPALAELKKEILDALGERPIAPDELSYFTSMQVNAFPAGYETSAPILGEQIAIWRYGLPADWPEQYLPQVRSVTVEAANQAFRSHVAPDHLVWVVVGDRAAVWDDLSAVGVEVIELDREGNPIEGG
ncbi:MAG: insulinase family protein, partial [Deltaproteobacteria bacterium]|nr:insulinase family protein [Deltaproteobacteria bacterium]